MDRATDLSTAVWHKSSYSEGGANDCVEVADHCGPGTVPVRDSKLSAGPVLVFGEDSWSAFLAGVKG
ncbi:DUF397 domain-containing protein [Streptomyces pharetrae]|uniref:DUF397 domain-containing protein n=1 Tax=Streptomyces pharetrae TaxID=291370 RepID=UPI00365CBD7B